MAPPPPPPPELTDDAVGEILRLIPPDDHALLLRASLVCKGWGRVLTDPGFIRSYGALHRTPPLLGFVRNTDDDVVRFVSTSAFRPRDPERRNCRVLDCRHGRVLLHDLTTRDFLLWDPVSGEDKHIPNDIKISPFNAAVLCAADDCDHLDCHGGPFLVVFVAAYGLPHEELAGYLEDEDEALAGAWVYSSAAGEWSAPTTVERATCRHIEHHPPVLSGDKLYFTCKFDSVVLCYDLRGEQGLSVIHGREPYTDCYNGIILAPVGDSGLGFFGLGYEDNLLDLWSLKMVDPDEDSDGDPDRVAGWGWSQCGSILIEEPPSRSIHSGPPSLNGFAKAPDSDVVFMSTDCGVFKILLDSSEVMKVCEEDCGDEPIFPYASFFTLDRAVGRLRFG